MIPSPPTFFGGMPMRTRRSRLRAREGGGFMIDRHGHRDSTVSQIHGMHRFDKEPGSSRTSHSLCLIGGIHNERPFFACHAINCPDAPLHGASLHGIVSQLGYAALIMSVIAAAVKQHLSIAFHPSPLRVLACNFLPQRHTLALRFTERIPCPPAVANSSSRWKFPGLSRSSGPTRQSNWSMSAARCVMADATFLKSP